MIAYLIAPVISAAVLIGVFQLAYMVDRFKYRRSR